MKSVPQEGRRENAGWGGNGARDGVGEERITQVANDIHLQLYFLDANVCIKYFSFPNVKYYFCSINHFKIQGARFYTHFSFYK